jgi:hypothetical protein
MSVHTKERMVPRDRPSLRKTSDLRSEKEGNVWGSKVKTISRRVEAMGSRSAFIVPMKVGNLTHKDPVEGREAP